MVRKRNSRLELFKVGVLVSLIAMLLSSLGGCKSGGESERVKSIKEGGLQLLVAIPPGDFRVGKEISITVSVKNVGGDIQLLHYSTAQRFDVEVKDSQGKTLWRWSEGQMFAQNYEEVKLKPDDSEDDDGTWSQKDASGNQVPPGVYTIIAQSAADELNNKTVSMNIKIVK